VILKQKENSVNELVRGLLSVGVGALFMTEEAIKKLLKDGVSSKDVISQLAQNTKNAKVKLNDLIREELNTALGKVRPVKIIEELLKENTIEIKASLRLVPRKNRTKKKQPKK
jgi:hypothetical protein